MRAWIRLGLAGGVIAATLLGVWMLGTQTILISDVQAVKHGDGMLHISMRIRNDGGPDRLISATSAEAKAVRLVSEDAKTFPIPADASVSLSSDGAQIMLMGVSGDLSDGRLIPLSLNFETAGEIAAKARVGPPMMMHGAMGEGEMGSAYDVPEGEQGPTLSMTVASVADGSWSIALEAENFTFSKEAADGPHQPGIGHAHLYVGGVKLGRLYEPSAIIPPLPAREHVVRVTLNTNDHKTYMVDGVPVTATLEITVPASD